jgi:hypothetical protein
VRVKMATNELMLLTNLAGAPPFNRGD